MARSREDSGEDYRVPAGGKEEFRLTTSIVVQIGNRVLENGEFGDKIPDILRPGAEIPVYEGGRSTKESIEKE